MQNQNDTCKQEGCKETITCKLYVEPGVSYKWRGSRSIDSNTAKSLRIKATAGRLKKGDIYVS